MIDTDKYEGHTPAPWKTGGYDVQAIKVWTVDGLDETQNWIHAPRADRLLAVDAPLLLAEVKRLHEWIYHHANNLDAGGIHRMGTPQPLSTFADEAREAIGVKRGEVQYD